MTRNSGIADDRHLFSNWVEHPFFCHWISHFSISSLPIFLLLVALQILILTKYYDKIKFPDALKLLFLFTLLFGSSLYLYPESRILYLPAIGIIFGISFMIRSRRNCTKSAILIIIIALLSAGLTSLFFYSRTIGHIVSFRP